MAKRHNNREGSLESLFFRLEELVLANSGEDEFEEVFKLLIAKLWAERSGNPAHFRVGRDEADTFAIVCQLLREAEHAWPGIIEPGSLPALTPEHLQVCVEALGHHTIGDSAFEVLDSFFEFIVSRAAKGAKGQFFTPRYVVELCVRLLDPSSSESLLDPACGSGAFLFHTLNYVKNAENISNNGLNKYCESKLWGFDIDTRAVRVAKTLMILAGDGKTNIVRLNSLINEKSNVKHLNEKNDTFSTLTIEDLIRTRLRNHKGFNIILTNPPFAGEVLERNILDNYELSNGKLKVERDILFIERCVSLLKPGGRMAMILPHNKFATLEFGHMREWLLEKCRIIGVVGLGRNTFLPHTHQKASILIVQKRRIGEVVSSDERIFFALSERDGKNSKGQNKFRDYVDAEKTLWNTIDHDFDDIVNEFKNFLIKESIEFEG